MRTIETETRYEYRKLFDVTVDREKLYSETVGKDDSGNLIFHKSSTYNMGNAYSTSDEFFFIDPDEYREYLDEAKENRLVSPWKYRKLLKEAGGPEKSPGRIRSFETVTLHISGMRHTGETEITMKGPEAEVAEYHIQYSGHEDRRVLDRSALCPESDILKLMNDCRLLSWDGFRGSHPKGVRDGIMFTLKASVNGGKSIYASGSENFPKHFREFRQGLHDILSSGGQD